MRQPLRSKAPQRQRVSGMQSYPAPIGGWNARDSLAAMPPTDAVRLINWWPRTTDVTIRGGSEEWGSGLSGQVETLAVYNALNGDNEMFGASATDIYDVTTQGAAVAQSRTVTNGRWQNVNFGDGTNNWLIMVNGVDKPQYYNGSSWVAVDNLSSPALTGVTSSTLVHVMVFKGRLIFIPVNSMSFWYLASGAAGGALTEFDLSSFALMGGYLVACTTMTVDGGNGPDDRAIFVTSEGQVIVYQGTDPSSSSDWSLVGVYYLGRPLGRRCFMKFGGDVILLTENGAFPLTSALQSTTVDRSVAISDKINQAFNTSAIDYFRNFGWEATFYQGQTAIVFNVPVSENANQEQYVMNTITKAWTRFQGWPANTFCVLNNELFYAGNGTVYRAWTGQSDLGADIVVDGKTAFSYFGSNEPKRFSMFRPVLQVNGNLDFLTGLDIDFGDSTIEGTAVYATTAGAIWDDDNWDESYWAANLEVVNQWTSPSANVGRSAAGKVKISTNTLLINWMACDYVYEKGAGLC